jgi:hypothetical protein
LQYGNLTSLNKRLSIEAISVKDQRPRNAYMVVKLLYYRGESELPYWGAELMKRVEGVIVSPLKIVCCIFSAEQN